MMNMTDEQLDRALRLAERFVLSFERIAVSLSGLDDTYKKRFAKQYPEREVRDAVISRVANEDDRLRESQGASSKPLNEWLAEDLADEESVGPREREWLQRDAGPKADTEALR